ncbi:hypothetical protein DL98DRAFT_598655 [Cadophora sp. DSE1049]|nr:hypothetical protein DL98DRAFT_598655 [Cadophora sp. DSE1049]
MSLSSGTYCSNAAETIPWSSTACAVTLQENNTAIMADCCGVNNVASYGSNHSDEYPWCYQYCNMSTPTFRESLVFECLDSSNLTGWSCRDALKGDASSMRKIDMVVLAGLVALAGTCIVGSL